MTVSHIPKWGSIPTHVVFRFHRIFMSELSRDGRLEARKVRLLLFRNEPRLIDRDFPSIPNRECDFTHRGADGSIDRHNLRFRSLLIVDSCIG
jgi:hypothetical protein